MIHTPRVWVPIWYSFLFLNTLPLSAQEDSITGTGTIPLVEDVVQAFLESRNDDLDMDFDVVMDRLESFKKKPINLNDSRQRDLDDFILLSPSQVTSLRTYIEKYGPLISIYELQVVPGFDYHIIKMIAPFIRLSASLDKYNMSLKEMFIKAENQVLFRLARILEPQKGYKQENSKSGYTGDPYKYYFRFHRSYGSRLSFAFCGEKDSGEEFFRGYNRSGFDSHSFHAGFHQLNRVIHDLILGDYTVNIGQGLLVQSGFGAGKTALATSIQQGGRTVKSYTSTNEYNYFRGISTLLKINSTLDLVMFYSRKKKDGNLINSSKNGTQVFSSFQESGYHRTMTEIENEKTILEQVMGVSLKYKFKSGHVGVNTIRSHFDHYFQKSEQVYNAFAFEGQDLALFSLDHQVPYKNMLFFGETAFGKSGAFAMVNGLQWSMDKRMDLALLYRKLNKNYPALYSNVFSENTTANNEQGVYLGAEIKPAIQWKLSAYWDFWNHPWYKFNIAGPSSGTEQFLRLTYSVKKKLEGYIQFKNKTKQENGKVVKPNETLTPVTAKHIRIQFNYRWSSGWESRSRLEGSFIHNRPQASSSGFLAFQDLLYHPMRSKYSFTARLAYFNTDGYESRIYAYENDILYNYSVPAFSGQGVRYYFNLRWELTPNLTVETRWAKTRAFNGSTLGSGLDEIEGNTRTELKFQVRWLF